MNIKISILIFIAFLGISILGKTQETEGFIIVGKFKDLPNGIKIYLTTQEGDTVAKSISEKGQFLFRGKLPLNGRFHFIKMDTLVSKVVTNAIFIVNKSIVIVGALGQSEVIVTGSIAHQDYTDLIGKTLGVEPDEKNRIVLKWIKNHPTSLYAPYVIKGYKRALGIEGQQDAYDKLSLDVKASYYGVKLKTALDIVKLAENVKPGKMLPDFKVTNLDGNDFSVLEYAKKSKVTLIDFWASWCKPCRAETPNMKKVYNAFHDKGFNIIGVSTDAKEADWKRAITEENTLWIHGRDNLDKASTSKFMINAIPAFALVDGEGKFIAFSCGMSNIPSFGPSIRGEELYKTIETLLKEKGK